MSYTINPQTGRKIKVGSPTYKRVFGNTQNSREIGPDGMPIQNFIEEKIRKPQKKSTSKSHGCSNQTKWKRTNIPESDFCGPEGGSCSYTYPVDTPGHFKAALSYSRHAPNPEGIRRCAYRKAQQKGFLH